jgi:hypothetical protein
MSVSTPCSPASSANHTDASFGLRDHPTEGDPAPTRQRVADMAARFRFHDGQFVER